MTIFGKDDRVVLKDISDDNPFIPPLVQITTDKGEDAKFIGTGFMVSPNVILTSKHVITDTTKAFEYDFNLFPGRDGDNYPYGSPNVLSAYHYLDVSIPPTGTPEEMERDWVLLRLDRNLGNFTNWLKLEVPGNNNTNRKVELLGYPGFAGGNDNTKDYDLYFSPDGSIGAENDFMLFSNDIDLSPGNSGGPLIDYNNLTAIALTTAESQLSNWFLKVTQEMVDQVGVYGTDPYMVEDYPDLAPKDDLFQDDPSSDFLVHSDTLEKVSDKSLDSFIMEVGDDMVLSASVYNVGTASPSQDVTVRWYFSEDRIITKDDINFRNDTLSKEDLNPFSHKTVGGSWKNDGSIDGGTYWVGYEIEYDGKEFDTPGHSYGNTSLLDGGQVTIEEASLDLSSVVWRFHNPDNSGHFFTADTTEAKYVRDNLTNYNFEGAAFFPATSEKGEDVYRFFNPNTGSHLYTTDENEKQYVQSNLKHFIFEGTGFYAFETEVENSSEVHRFYRPSLGSHIYTADLNEVDYIKENLTEYYEYEGIAFYAYSTQDFGTPSLV